MTSDKRKIFILTAHNYSTEVKVEVFDTLEEAERFKNFSSGSEVYSEIAIHEVDI